MKFLLPAGLTLLILGLGQFSAVSESADLVEVVDGDTLNTENDTVRFLGVDTPETSAIAENNPSDYGLVNNSETVECLDRYGEKSSKFVENRVDEKVNLINDRASDERGTYDRKLAYIRSGGDINRKLVVEGLARIYPSDFSRKNEFYFWERVAKENDRGLWSCQY